MKQTWYTRWLNWRWHPANIRGRYRMRRLPTMTPRQPGEQFDGSGVGGSVDE